MKCEFRISLKLSLQSQLLSQRIYFSIVNSTLRSCGQTFKSRLQGNPTGLLSKKKRKIKSKIKYTAQNSYGLRGTAYRLTVI